MRKNAKLVQEKSQGCRLLTPEEMDRNLSRERERCDRYCQYFSLIIVRAPDGMMEKFAENLDIFLEERLRLSDDAGYLRKGGIGILLPMTDLEGAQIVLAGVHQFAQDKKISVTTEVFTYSGHGGNGPESLADPIDAKSQDGGDVGGNQGSDIQFSAQSDRPKFGGSVAVYPGASRLPSSSHGFAPMGTGASTQILQIEDEGFDPLELFARTKPNLNRRVVKKGVVHGHREDALLEHCAAPFPKWKRGLDITAAVSGLILTSPILIGAAIAIKATSRGPVFFKQMRSGQYGRPFPVYKLRTMVVDAEELKAALQERNERDGPAFKLKNDPRVTKVGHFLRRVGADELPQLVNVLLGHMSIVGPRPLPIAEDIQCATWQRKRLDTKPGLTCTWQIGKSRGISFMEWMRLDRKYGKDRSIVTDIKLVFKTIGAVIMGRVGH